MRYDPERPPAADVWKSLDEGEAELMIMQHHRSPRCEHPPAPNPRLHAAAHLIVENQAATADLPVADALRRLVAEGLSRHEAVHAVGWLVARHLFPALGSGAKPPDLNQYYEEVSSLTAQAWLRSVDEDSEVLEPFEKRDDDALIDLLFTEEDRLPREAVDEIVARSARMIDRLVAIVVDRSHWNAPFPEWWAPIHATFILGAIDDPAGDAALLFALREADADDDDWICEAMPAILGKRGARLRPTLLGMLADRAESVGIRCTAISGLAAGTLADPDARTEVFARIAEVFGDANEDAWIREHAGQVLLDFQVRESEQALRDFARKAEAHQDTARPVGTPHVVAFAEADVTEAFSQPQSLADYTRPWLEFYDAEAIAARQKRWAREEVERAAREREEILPPKVRRNEPCPCGSGRKYKKCCLGV